MMRPEHGQSIIQLPGHPHPVRLISIPDHGNAYACTQCSLAFVVPGAAAHAPTFQRPPGPRGVTPAFDGAQVQAQYPVQYYNSFPGAVHPNQSATWRPQGVNNVAPGQSVGVNQNSQVGRPQVSFAYSIMTAVAHGFAEGAAPTVGQDLTYDVIDQGRGGDDGWVAGGDDGWVAGGDDGWAAGGDDGWAAGGDYGGGF